MDKSSFKILIADDDEIVQDVIVRFLEDEGFSVEVAHNGLEAISVLKQREIHLVLSDLRMPGADGMEVLKTAIQLHPRTAVVILTAYGTLDTALEAMKEGAYDYIVKPFVMQQLLLVVRNAFRMASLLKENDRLSEKLRAAHLSLDPANENESGTSRQNGRQQSLQAILLLREKSILNDSEADTLKGRLVDDGSDKDMKKYSALVNTLKRIN